MKSQRTLYMLGLLVGTVIIITSIVQYRFLYPDTDKFLMYAGVGAIVLFVSYIFDLLRDVREDLNQLKDNYFEFEGWTRDKFEVKRDDETKNTTKSD